MTLVELLDEYFYKEWIQSILGDFREKVSGTKSELIERLLQSKWARSQSVTEVAQYLLSVTRLRDLRELGKNIGRPVEEDRDKIVDSILANVTFEPYVALSKRSCGNCGEKTLHETHFNSDWEREYTVCTKCQKKDIVKLLGESLTVEPAPTMKLTYGWDARSLEWMAILVTVYFGITSLLSLPLVSIYGWTNGAVSSIILGLPLTYLCGWLIRRQWVKNKLIPRLRRI